MKRILSVCLVAILAICFSLSGEAQTLADQQRRRARLEKDMEILQKQLKSSSARTEQALSTITLLQAQQNTRRSLIKETNRSIARYNWEIENARIELQRLKNALDTLKTHYEHLILGAYKTRDIKTWYMYILSSDNLSQAFRRFAYFKSLSSQISAQARSIESVQAEMELKKAKYSELVAQAKLVKASRERELKNLKMDEARQQACVRRLKLDSKTYSKALKAKKDELKELDKKIAYMIQEAGRTGKKKGKPIDYTLAAKFEKNKGKLPWPVDGPVAEHFGPYENKALKISLVSNGITIACDPGSKVTAVFDGVVSNVMLAPGYGQCLLIQHGDYYTTYCKLKSCSVHQGDKVKTGQEIGEVATINGKTQLYLLLWHKVYLDPEQWLRRR